MVEKIRDKSIKGPVAQITEYNYITLKESSNKLNQRLKYKDVSVYDSKKRLTEKTCYEGNGDFYQKETFLYNEKGLLIEELAISVVQPKDSKLTYKYNSKGQLIERNLFYSNQFIKSVYYDYNEYGLLESKHGLDDFDVPYKISYEYDQDGNFVQEHIPLPYAFSGRFNYDESGRVIENLSLKEGKRIKDYFSYDEKGFIFESRAFELRQVDSDEWIEEIYGRQTYKYDDRGNLIECCHYDSSLMVTSKDNFVYAYDDYGNWTRIMEFLNGELKKVSERKIDYALLFRKNFLQKNNIKNSVISIVEREFSAIDRFGEQIKTDFISEEKNYFNELGEITKTIKYDSNQNVYSECIFTFNDKDLPIKKVTLIKQNIIISEANYLYNEEDYLVKMIKEEPPTPEYNRFGKTTVIIYKYDFRGWLIEQKQFRTSENPHLYPTEEFITRYEHDDMGNVIKEYDGNFDDNNLSTSKKYDTDGYLIEEFHHLTETTTMFKYDTNGNTVGENHYDSDGAITNKYSFVYTYDDNDNWTQKICFANLKISSVVERVIEYRKA